MRGSSARLARKAGKEAVKQTEDAVGPVLIAAQQHSFLLQNRIKALEDSLSMLIGYAETTEKLAQKLAAWRGRSFLGRLRWLFLGR